MHLQFTLFELSSFLPDGSYSKQSARNARDPGSIPGLGRSPGEGRGNPLQCSCLESGMSRRAWWVTVYRVEKESDTAEQLTLHFICNTLPTSL